MAFYAPVHHTQGETLAHVVFAVASASTLVGARLVVRKQPGAAAALDLTHAAGLTLSAGAGTVAPSRTAAQTYALAAGAYEYDLECEFADGSRRCTHFGGWYVSPAVTPV